MFAVERVHRSRNPRKERVGPFSIIANSPMGEPVLLASFNMDSAQLEVIPHSPSDIARAILNQKLYKLWLLPECSELLGSKDQPEKRGHSVLVGVTDY